MTTRGGVIAAKYARVGTLTFEHLARDIDDAIREEMEAHKAAETDTVVWKTTDTKPAPDTTERRLFTAIMRAALEPRQLGSDTKNDLADIAAQELIIYLNNKNPKQ